MTSYHQMVRAWFRGAVQPDSTKALHSWYFLKHHIRMASSFKYVLLHPLTLYLVVLLPSFFTVFCVSSRLLLKRPVPPILLSMLGFRGSCIPAPSERCGARSHHCLLVVWLVRGWSCHYRSLCICRLCRNVMLLCIMMLHLA